VVALLLNHAIVDGMATRRDDTVEHLKALRRTLDAARRVNPEAALYVHDNLWQRTPDGAVDLHTWSSRQLNVASWKDALLGLLQACTEGPYLSSLLCDSVGPPTAIAPTISRPDLECVVSRGLHHRLSHEDHVAYVLSYGKAGEELPDAQYEGTRNFCCVILPNHLDEHAASKALDKLARENLATRRDVLKHVESTCPNVRILDRVHKNIDSAHIDVPLGKLLSALCGFEEYARATAEGGVPKQIYEGFTGIEISDESAGVYNKPSRRKQLEFEVPGYGKKVFGYHSKVGASTRIHVWCSVDVEKRPDGSERRVATVWIGRIDAHPKGARD
jgi:hypothetical protein